MSFHRIVLAACTAAFAVIVSSTAFAGCGGCGFAAPAIEYAPTPVYAAPMAYAGGGCCGGCGGCGVSVAVTYAQPVVYAQPTPVVIAPQPIAVDHWDSGGWGGWSGGCGCCGGCGGTAAYAVAPTAAYVVNQGPYYSGPGMMIPYGTYSPSYGLANPAAYPYVGAAGYGYGYGRGYAPPYAGYGYGYGRGYARPYAGYGYGYGRGYARSYYGAPAAHYGRYRHYPYYWRG